MIDSPGDIEYQVKRQRRKSLALHILPDATVEVRAPQWVAKRDIVAFVEERALWVLEQRNKVLQKMALRPKYQTGHYHNYLGERFPLQVIEAGRASVRLVDGVFVVKVRQPNSEQQVQQALEQWYRRQAKGLLAERLQLCYQQLPHHCLAFRALPELTVRKMKSRWGSCSNRGNITLNSLLVKMPLATIDYVVMHELCHLWEFNHSPAFYRLLSRLVPDWQQHKILLDQCSE